MRTLLIATVLAGMTASAASAQVTATAPQGNMRMGGHWGGGTGGGGTMGGGTMGGMRGGWSGGQHTNIRVNTGQTQSQSQWQRQGGSWSGGGWSGGQRVGGDPRTWSPTNPPRVGGDPRTWGPGNQPRHWNGGGNWHGGGAWGGGYVGGRWDAGNRAPGGWNAYRRPQRGWTMPGYWRSPDYRILNWGYFGLQAPPAGYGWSRYYDDAVLVDDYGRVYDSVGGLDWGGYDQPYDDGYGYPSQGYANAPDAYRYQGYSDPRCYKRKKGSGIGGAIIGGALGAGIAVATGGAAGPALIAGGGGALLGQAIDRESRGRVVCDGGYGPAGGYDYGYAGQNGYAYAGDGYAYAQGGQGGYSYGYQGGYGYAPGVTATATVEFDMPVTTTTTTTTTEEWVSVPRKQVIYRTYIKKVPVYRKPAKVWRQTKGCGDDCGGS